MPIFLASSSTRVDASVADEPLHELPRNLLAHRVEATDDHRLGRIVDEDADAGRRLDRADVASLTADDPPLHLVARQRDGRRGALIRAVARIALNRVGQNAARLALALRLRFLEQIPDHDAGFILDFVLELLKQDSARLFTPELGDAFEFVDLLRNALRKLLFAVRKPLPQGFDLLFLLFEILGLRIHRIGAAVEQLLALGETLLVVRLLAAAFLDLLLAVLAHLQGLALGRHAGVAQDVFGFPLRILPDLVGGLVRGILLHFLDPVIQQHPGGDADKAENAGHGDQRPVGDIAASGHQIDVRLRHPDRHPGCRCPQQIVHYHFPFSLRGTVSATGAPLFHN